MSLFEIVLLALVQGLTEFLPISSSGHLVIVSEMLGGAGANADVNIVLHTGTLLSILVFFRRRIVALASEDRRVIWLLLVGSLPAAAAGWLVKSRYSALLESALLSGFMLVATGLLLLGTRWLVSGRERYQGMTATSSFKVGLFQALALLPGMSRSGATIFGGLLVGLDRQSAAAFSFLLAIPAIGGASLYEIRELTANGSASASPGLLSIGCAVAAVVGLASLAWLFSWIERGKLHYFSFWCIPLGLAVIVWQLLS